ncbi:MAG: 4-hydroxythreonine-4-phosphate dehydrogenase PdxA [bacterium]|nr:4-hydroxythreonine-4-phosphate dehydrogenase PdxA [bacterium]
MKKILVSMGEGGGAGIILLCDAARKNKDILFELVSDEKALKDYCRKTKISLPENISLIQTKAKNFRLIPGKPTGESGRLAFESLKESVDIISATENEYLGLLTLPVIKSSMNVFCRGFSGHTEYLAKREKRRAAMLLYSKKISVVPLTTHVNLSRVSKLINFETVNAQMKAVKDFYSERLKKEGKFAILCVNPHCSDNNLLGYEDENLRKIVCRLKKHFNLDGPLCADSAFTSENLKRYDVFFGMYHDQVLIPFKMVSFNSGVNVTCGLTYLRVSPDHGPACDRVFSNELDSGSILESVKLLLKVKKS